MRLLVIRLYLFPKQRHLSTPHFAFRLRSVDLSIYFLELPNAYTQLNHSFRTSAPNISAPHTYQMTIQKLTKY